MINIIGYFAGELGLGVVARNVARAIARLGIPPACSLIPAAMGRDRVTPPFPTPPSGQIDVRFSSTLVIAGAAPTEWMLGVVRSLRGRTRLAILAYWELTELPPAAVEFLEHADILFGGSPFTRDVFQRYFPGKPCYELPCPIDFAPPAAPVPRQAFGLPERVPLVLISFEPLSDPRRKNGEGAIEAFMASEQRHDAHLILKVNWPASIPKDDQFPLFKAARELIENARSKPRVSVIDEALAYDRLIQLYSCADVVVSLHRAEGLGLVLLEAMLLGKPVIATGWSGNLAFMDHSSASLVRYQLVPASGTYEYYRANQYPRTPIWAEPDVGHAADLLTRTVTDSSFAAALRDEGARGAQAYQQRAWKADWLSRLVSFSPPYQNVSYSWSA